MTISVGDYLEIYTKGWYNTDSGTTTHPVAVQTAGWYYGLYVPAVARLVLDTNVQGALSIKTAST